MDFTAKLPSLYKAVSIKSCYFHVRNMIHIARTNSKNVDFVELVKHLDAELAIRDGDDHDFYHQYNGIDHLKYVAVAYMNDQAIACGAINEYDSTHVEIKRMYTLPENRGEGIAGKLLSELEKWAKELNYKACILETGKAQPEAIALYTKCAYSIISNYGQYAGVDNSVCFEKKLT